MIRGNSFKLFVISTIITQSENVILIEPPRNEAALSKTYMSGVSQFKHHSLSIGNKYK